MSVGAPTGYMTSLTKTARSDADRRQVRCGHARRGSVEDVKLATELAHNIPRGGALGEAGWPAPRQAGLTSFCAPRPRRATLRIIPYEACISQPN